MKNLIFLITLSISVNLFSQNAPVVILKDKSQLKLTHLNIDVKIVGNFATTTYDMKFYNPLDRTLEGELTFPLGEGQTVSRFAMDVNGALREAVIVEKELARVAFENTVGQKIDPGLLEKTKGNNYKARVYPIFPKSDKRIVVTYEQELFISNTIQTYELPLGIRESINEFSLVINVFGNKGIPKIKDKSYKNIQFKSRTYYYQAKVERKNFIPEKPLIIQLNNKSKDDKVLTHKDYFYLHKVLEPKTRLKQKPEKITVLWDASYSQKYRRLQEETELLNDYFKYLENVEVQFISFSNTVKINKVIKVKNGKWKAIEKLIKNIKYDGGTSFSSFNTLDSNSDEILLFSDGMNNLGEFKKHNKRPIYTINSLISANHTALKNMATHSGGYYINLLRLPVSEALKILKNETFQFLGLTHDNSIREVYPFTRENVTSDFSISGRFTKDTSIELLFGYQDEITQRIKIPIKKSDETKLIKRLWAKHKLKFLNTNKKQNQKKIVSHAKQYHLITDYTSMLVLDRIEDYVRYRIEPPDELKQDYKRRIKNIEVEEASKRDELLERKEELVDDYNDLSNWYNTKYPLVEEKQIYPNKTPVVSQNQNNTQTESSINQSVSDPITVDQNTNQRATSRSESIDYTKRVVSGIISDDSGPLPGVSVLIKGGNEGTETDFDGKYAINAEIGDELVFSYVGMDTTSTTISTTDTYNIVMQGGEALDEVVITALGVNREKKTMSYAVSSVMSPSLNGKVSGVNISGESGISPTITIRGSNSLSSDVPMCIVDGKVVKATEITALKPEDIETIQELKSDNATKLYGSRAINGLLIITTKKGQIKNKDEIRKIEKQIVDKIKLKPWNPNTPYLKILEGELTVEDAYLKYLKIRDTYSNSPSFYLDVADFFDNKNHPQKAITVLSNLIEVEIDNYELMKALAYKLEYFKQYELAVIVYKKILEIRPEEPQSYRDLALVYEQTGEIQKCFDLLNKIYSGELLEKDEDERYYGIEHIAFVELTRLVNNYENKLKLPKVQKTNFQNITTDIRVVIDWNHNDTDIDLWVIDPNNEKAYYSNKKTKIGGRMSTDMTEGYGPETFMLRNAIKGDYQIMVDYYSDNVQKISGPTILKATLYTNYSKKSETKETIIIRLDKKEGEIEIGSISI